MRTITRAGNDLVQFLCMVRLTQKTYPVFHVIPHTLGITAQAYELPHK